MCVCVGGGGALKAKNGVVWGLPSSDRQLTAKKLNMQLEYKQHHPRHGYLDINKIPMPDRAVKIGIFVLSLDCCLPKLLCHISIELTNRHKQESDYVIVV